MSEQRFDLVVRNGTVVTRGHREQADVGITGSRIAQLGGTMTGAEEIDANGLLVIPGGIDAHVHLMCAQLTARMAAGQPGEPAWVDDFWTGSLAAIAGGITTIGNMTFALPGESMTEAVARDMAGARAEAAVDWFLHPVLTGLGGHELAEIEALAAGGHTSVKVFLSNPGFAAGTPGLAEAVAAAGRAGSITLVHCEDAHELERTGRELMETGRGAVRYFPDARTVGAEVTAVKPRLSYSRRAATPGSSTPMSIVSAPRQRASRRAASMSARPRPRRSGMTHSSDSYHSGPVLQIAARKGRTASPAGTSGPSRQLGSHHAAYGQGIAGDRSVTRAHLGRSHRSRGAAGMAASW